MPVVDDAFGRAGIITEAERLQRGVVLGGLAADVNRRLALSIGDGKVLMPVSGSCKTAESNSVGKDTKFGGYKRKPCLWKSACSNTGISL